MKLNEILNSVALMISILGAVYLIPVIADYWHRPIFRCGFLDDDKDLVRSALCVVDGKRPNISNWKPIPSIQYRSKDSIYIVPLFIANIGRGDVKEAHILVEIWSNNIVLEEITCDHLQQHYANLPHDDLKDKSFQQHICPIEISEYYQGIGISGNFLEFKGDLPADTFEVVLFKVSIKNKAENKVKFKVKVRTDQRRFQQPPVQQELVFKSMKNEQ